MSQPTYSTKLPYKIRCNLPECEKPVNLVFTKVLDGVACRFCSPGHATTGEDRWEEKKEKNIRMDVPPPQNTTQDEYIDSEIPE